MLKAYLISMFPITPAKQFRRFRQH